jgi:hypothetical protein
MERLATGRQERRWLNRWVLGFGLEGSKMLYLSMGID